jgi:hypothetical protein
MIAEKLGSNLFAALMQQSIRSSNMVQKTCQPVAAPSIMFAVCRSLKGISWRDAPSAPSKPWSTREVLGPYYQRKLIRAINFGAAKKLDTDGE